MNWTLALLLAAGALVSGAAAAPARPFPQHTAYTAGSIEPTITNQAGLDAAVVDFYAIWKSKYLFPADNGEYYVFYKADEKPNVSAGRSISEGHGYGMLLTVIMAGSDADAHTEYDGLYRYFRAHPSKFNNDLMAWHQVDGFVDPRHGNDSATDGDLDIAYSLLLAAQQWGNAGDINYQAEAESVIAAIMQDEVNQDRWTTKLGDWADPTSSYYDGTRSSDWMIQHFKAFRQATGDERWTQVIDTTYAMLADLYARKSPKTGLMPDFVVRRHGQYAPAPANYLESTHDGEYFYNACRTPWRLTTDYLINGDPRALAQVQAINAWIQNKTAGLPAKINAGYTLRGQRLKYDRSAAFLGPLGVAAMVGAENQTWLNDIWTELLARDPDKDDDYYGNSLKLLSMIVMSGNWWAP